MDADPTHVGSAVVAEQGGHDVGDLGVGVAQVVAELAFLGRLLGPTGRHQRKGRAEEGREREVDLADGAGEPLLTLGQLSVGIDALRPLDKQVQIGTVALQSPHLLARRDAAGRLNLALATAGGVRVDPAAATAEAASEEPAWTASMQHLAVRDGTVSWHDAAVAPQAQLRLRDLTVDVDDLVWPMERAAQFKGAMLLQSLADRAQDRAGAAPAGDGSTTARLAFDGRATDREAALALTVAEAPLRLAAPYLAQFIEPQLHGQLDASMELRWGERGLQVAVPSLTLDRLALVRSGGAAPQELAQVQRIAVSSAAVDLDRRTLQLERLEIRQPRLAVTRAADQRWMFESWLKPAVTAGEPKAQAAAGAGGAPWTGAVAQARVIDGTVRFEDAAHARPVQLALSGLQLDLQGVSLDGKEPIRTHLSARVDPRGELGTPRRSEFPRRTRRIEFAERLEIRPIGAR